ncbi:MAG: ASKHA domain-containing protein [Alphaproteobacteria bacterium]|jgi:uncharacterized 2Fe-2S/4Fe-4S cluster protein (DUF4445 family)|nr:ASKHA domain-containing protein [Alphaproteobacteria bacterium]MDP6515498.1 ASKHA domain-containing protein [Alphaproteobacteria bacterium]
MNESKLDMAGDALVVFTPSGRRGRFPLGTPVLTAARSLGVDIDSVCGGRSLCGRCQVSLSIGAFPKFAITSEQSHLHPITEAERRLGDSGLLAPGHRLSCVALIAGDAVIDVPPESQIHKQIIRKRVEAHPVEIDPVVMLHYVEVALPSLEDQTSDLGRLERALREQWNLSDLDFDAEVLGVLPDALSQDRGKCTVAVRQGKRLVAVWPGFRDRAFGLAVDVGTTTIAAHLCDLASGEVVAASGAMNPQIRFGEDVMSRLSYIQLNPESAGAPTAAVRRAIDQLAAETAAHAGIATDQIVEMTLVGNPIMHHFLLGIDPQPLGRAPFTLVVDRAVEMKVAALDLDLHPCASAYFLPCIAGHIGADAAGVLLSEAPHEAGRVTLVVDVGTNAELMLGDRHRLLACSSPTGPAFEGAQISCGQRAAPGAIERVRIDRETLAPRFRVIGCALWSDEPGFDEAVAATGVTGICGSGIIEAVAEMHSTGIVADSGLIDGTKLGRNPYLIDNGATFDYRLHDGPPELRITQLDVRAIQLAKAALYAGAQLLMARAGIDAVERIVLAGAFGSYIDPRYALVLGMIPDCPLEQVSAAGNAAGTGARIALLSRRARGEIEALVRRVEKVETAADRDFQRHFVAAMTIPHATDSFPTFAGSDGKADPAVVVPSRDLAGVTTKEKGTDPWHP